MKKSLTVVLALMAVLVLVLSACAPASHGNASTRHTSAH